MSVEPESVATVCGHLRRCLEMRDKYIAASGQFINPKDSWSIDEIAASGKPLDPNTVPAKDPSFSYQLTPEGVYEWTGPKGIYSEYQKVPIPTVAQYYDDFEAICQLCSDGPTKTWAFRRLRLLSTNFQLHILQNEQAEKSEQRKAMHRDFYNVRKVDTHVHHSSAMNSKHLLRFIKSKLKHDPDDKVIVRDGQEMTLKQVFESLKLTAYDLSIDALDMHAHKDTFHRFDRFNLKYNPLGEARLREIFMKTDNYINGRYLAEITKQVFDDLTASKYQMAEYRLSIYGRNVNEWSKLAEWVVGNNMYCDNVRWLVQIPRLYQLYRSAGSLKNFEQFIQSTLNCGPCNIFTVDIFEPLFRVSVDPSSDPKLHHFMKRIAGFDTVDDESRRERRMYKHVPRPSEWTNESNPPYSYYMYFLYANISSLNRLRMSLGLSTTFLLGY
jgi:AMP deaminase